MGDTKIQWTDATWNPVRGCSRVSEGCRNCYAERQAARFSGPGQYAEGFVRDGKWTGRVELVPEKLDEPLRWRKPRRVFVNSMSDLFHESLPDEAIDRVFAVTALAQQHTFQVLTKRPERMRRYFADEAAHWSEDTPRNREWHINNAAIEMTKGELGLFPWPLPNVWLGVSVEGQKTADERIPILLDTPAAVRFISVEPLLGPVDLANSLYHSGRMNEELGPRIDWLIVGGESGPGARPCDVAWIRSAVEQCKAAGVACFVKQDSGPRPGMQGRLDDAIWQVKEYPRG